MNVDIISLLNGEKTIIGFSGCNLACKYCNLSSKLYENLSCESLFMKLDLFNVKDICFSGGEPLLHVDFILEFIDYMRSNGLNCRLGIQTNLNIEINDKIKRLLDSLDYIIVDIKDMSSDIYECYTSKSIDLLYGNLRYLVDYCFVDIKIRIPKIVDYNTVIDRKYSSHKLFDLGFSPNCIEFVKYDRNGSCYT